MLGLVHRLAGSLRVLLSSAGVSSQSRQSWVSSTLLNWGEFTGWAVLRVILLSSAGVSSQPGQS